MSYRRQIAKRFLRGGNWLLVACGLALLILASPVRGEPVVRPPCDAALGPDGSLLGHVVRELGASEKTVAPASRVLLVSQGRVVAETKSDSRGRFRLRNLGSGLCQLVVDGPQGTGVCCCRLWPALAAPPSAVQHVTVVMDDRVVRGQSPFPPTKIPTGVVLTAIAAGAVAVPVIYNNTKSEPRIPASP